uniref:Myb/SANT-like domain-containing protein n=1 Tax=Lactuca sativa TaxID=4236 RepID=A0A9R1W221_LACSA|nr:hypothetical protein LSAT_V11C300153640 [Lactuca sativa]
MIVFLSVMYTVNVHDMDFDTTKVKLQIGMYDRAKNANRASSYFKSVVCQNICKRLLERTGKELDRNQMKNKLDIMRKEFKYYDRLTRLEMEISVDPVKNTISASKEWWDDKIKEDKEFAKFKDKNLDVYQTYYEALFRDTVAIGDKPKVPYEFGDNSTPNGVQLVDITDGKEDIDEVLLFDDERKKLTPRRNRKRKFEGKNEEKSEGKTMANSSYEQKLDTVFDVLLTRSTQPSRQTT